METGFRGVLHGAIQRQQTDVQLGRVLALQRRRDDLANTAGGVLLAPEQSTAIDAENNAKLRFVGRVDPHRQNLVLAVPVFRHAGWSDLQRRALQTGGGIDKWHHVCVKNISPTNPKCIFGGVWEQRPQPGGKRNPGGGQPSDVSGPPSTCQRTPPPPRVALARGPLALNPEP